MSNMADNWSEEPPLANRESSLKIKKYDPGKSPYKPRISRLSWNNIRPILERLHKAGKKRWEMLEVLARDYDLFPSRHQLNVRMVRWGLRVHKTGPERDSRESSFDGVQSNTQPNGGQFLDATMDYKATTSRPVTGSTSQDFSASFQDIFQDMLMQILQGNAPLHHSEWFCVLHDIIDFLKHSLWYAKYSHIFVRYLMHIVESRGVAITTDAHLVVVLDCLRWPASESESFMTDWAYDQLEKLASGSVGSLSHECTLLFLRCCNIGSERSISKNWTNLIDRIIMSCQIPSLRLDYEARSDNIFSPILYSFTDIVAVEHNFRGQRAYLDHDRVDALLTWCGTSVESFTPNLHVNTADSTHVNIQYLRESYSELSRYLIHRWIEHTHKVPVNSVTPDWSTHTQTSSGQQSWSDIVVFRAIARTLAFLSILIITKSRNFLLASIGGTQHPCQLTDMLSSVAQVYRTAIQEIEWEHSEASLQPSEHTPPALGDLDEDTIAKTIQHSAAHATGTAYELYTLRQSPGSTRHGYALSQLPCRLKKWKGFTASNGANVTLCKTSSSSSSLRSFSRAGIKMTDRFGTSSSSGKSSAAFTKGSMFSIAEWSSTLFDDENILDPEVEIQVT